MGATAGVSLSGGIGIGGGYGGVGIGGTLGGGLSGGLGGMGGGLGGVGLGGMGLPPASYSTPPLSAPAVSTSEWTITEALKQQFVGNYQSILKANPQFLTGTKQRAQGNTICRKRSHFFFHSIGLGQG